MLKSQRVKDWAKDVFVIHGIDYSGVFFNLLLWRDTIDLWRGGHVQTLAAVEVLWVVHQREVGFAVWGILLALAVLLAALLGRLGDSDGIRRHIS